MAMTTKSTTSTAPAKEPVAAPAPIAAPKSGGSYKLAVPMCLKKGHVSDVGTIVTPDMFSEESWKKHLGKGNIVEA